MAKTNERPVSDQYEVPEVERTSTKTVLIEDLEEVLFAYFTTVQYLPPEVKASASLMAQDLGPGWLTTSPMTASSWTGPTARFRSTAA